MLNVGYAEAGPGGPAVILLHGWPYDIHSFADVTPALASAGYRVIVPFVRGHGTPLLWPIRPVTASKRPWLLMSSRTWMRRPSSRR